MQDHRLPSAGSFRPSLALSKQPFLLGGLQPGRKPATPSFQERLVKEFRRDVAAQAFDPPRMPRLSIASNSVWRVELAWESMPREFGATLRQNTEPVDRCDAPTPCHWPSGVASIFSRSGCSADHCGLCHVFEVIAEHPGMDCLMQCDAAVTRVVHGISARRQKSA